LKDWVVPKYNPTPRAGGGGGGGGGGKGVEERGQMLQASQACPCCKWGGRGGASRQQRMQGAGSGDKKREAVTGARREGGCCYRRHNGGGGGESTCPQLLQRVQAQASPSCRQPPHTPCHSTSHLAAAPLPIRAIPWALQKHLWQLGRLMPPRLCAHLEGCGVLPSLYAASWLMTCFSADFPASFSAR
jgi:hypothetical protein